jgi:hypothetical protein
MKGRIGFPNYGKNFAKETANFKKIIKTEKNHSIGTKISVVHPNPPLCTLACRYDI